MIFLHFFRNRSRLEMVRESPVGFSLAAAFCLTNLDNKLDQAWPPVQSLYGSTVPKPRASREPFLEHQTSGVFLMLQIGTYWNTFDPVLSKKTPRKNRSNFLVGDTNSQTSESLGVSAVSSPCFLTCRNKESRFGTRIPGSIEALPKKGNESQRCQT